MWQARLRLGSLLLSHTARVAADVSLGLAVVGLAWGRLEDSPWQKLAIALAVPAILLAPLIGILCDVLPRPRLLAGAALLGLFVLAPSHWESGTCVGCWGLMGVRAALYRVAQRALLPAAAADAGIALSRVHAAFIAAAGGAAYVLLRGDDSWFWQVRHGHSLPIILVYAFNLAALLLALLVSFPSDRSRVSAPASLDSFVAAFGTIVRGRETRQALIGSAGLHVLLVAPLTLIQVGSVETRTAISLFGGVAVGALLAGLQGHPRRILAFIPLGATGLTVCLAWACVPDLAVERGARGETLRFVYGMMAGLPLVAVATQFQTRLPATFLGQATALRMMTDWLGVALGVCLAGFTRELRSALADRVALPEESLMWFLTAATGLAALYAWWVHRREVVEQLVEFIFAVMYRFHGHGPGIDQCPTHGPLLVIANHSCWMDPMWLAKVLPRTLIPMMTSTYFDKPVLRWMMVYLADAIRVEEAHFRREVPELKQAVAALDAGKCLVIFPEGSLRRREDVALKRFGQGVWHILRERPQTPVLVCWIEGGWGSYFSYWNGPPLRNKRFDFQRRVDVVLAAPQVLAPDILDDHLRTRQYLQEECLRVRASLGLAPSTGEEPEAAEEVPVHQPTNHIVPQENRHEST
jgi:1-acyl-sn-glycerol-3-phosphate acyltransferase